MDKADNPAERFLGEEFPAHRYHLIPSALLRAYAAADHAIEMLEFLATPGGRFQRGDLIAAAAEFEFKKLIDSGDLPFDYSWEWYHRKTGKHIVTWTPRARCTISQVEDWAKKP